MCSHRKIIHKYDAGIIAKPQGIWKAIRMELIFTTNQKMIQCKIGNASITVINIVFIRFSGFLFFCNFKISALSLITSIIPPCKTIFYKKVLSLFAIHLKKWLNFWVYINLRPIRYSNSTF